MKPSTWLTVAAASNTDDDVEGARLSSQIISKVAVISPSPLVDKVGNIWDMDAGGTVGNGFEAFEVTADDLSFSRSDVYNDLGRSCRAAAYVSRLSETKY